MTGILNDAAIANMLNDSGDDISDDEEEDLHLQPEEDRDDSDSTSSDSDDDSEDDNIPLSQLRWQKKLFNSKPIPQDAVRPPGDIHTPSEYFERYFTSELLEQFALTTNQYYMVNTGMQMKPICTLADIRKFFVIHAMIGCIKFPRLKLYWNERFRYDPIENAMSRERFFLLRSNLHVVDVTSVNQAEEQAKNKLWRVQPVIDAVRNRCLELPRDAGNYSIDEQMIPFDGRCAGLKVVVRNKPRPAGLKNFVVTDYKGQVLDFEIYQGNTTNLPDSENFGIGAAVVLRVARSLPEGSFLYFDRYFSSVPLMTELVKRKIEGTATLMANRFNTKKKTKYEFKKDHNMTRGQDEAIVNSDNNISIVKWKDNKGVLMISTAFGAEPRTQVSRWEKKRKQYIQVSCPAIVKNYNTYMGGVDVCDQMMENYRTWRKSRKWTVKVILHMFDLAIVNSWFEYRADCKANKRKSKDIMDLLSFRLSISDHLLIGPPRKRKRDDLEFADVPTSSRYRVKSLPTIDRQYDGFNHWPVFDTLKQPRCCRASGCTSRSRCRCTKCDIYLCLTKDRNCFFDFHTKD